MYSTSKTDEWNGQRVRTEGTVKNDGSITYEIRSVPPLDSEWPQVIAKFELPPGVLPLMMDDLQTMSRMGARRSALASGENPDTLPSRYSSKPNHRKGADESTQDDYDDEDDDDVF